ncbi:MAG: TRAP transporter small permease [Defluviitaleaceae bacterium]|nr:TRAP transporter small permease [Defluviitaleaceae bacterium]
MLKAYDIYKRIIRAMTKVLDVVIIILMLAMVAVVFYQVIMRQIFANPPMWGEQISVLFMVWFVFLGIVLGLEEDLHIGITMFVNMLPKQLMFPIEIFVNLLIGGLAVLYIRFGFNHFAFLWRTGAVMPVTGLPNAIYYLPVSLTGAMMILVLLGKIAEQIIKRKELPA